MKYQDRKYEYQEDYKNIPEPYNLAGLKMIVSIMIENGSTVKRYRETI